MESRNLSKKRNTRVHNVSQSSSRPKILKTRDMPNSETATADVFGDERTGYILSHTPPIVERILEDLPVHVLNKCACVCKLWNSVVQAIKRRRNNIFWMFKVRTARQDYDSHVDANNPKHAIFAAKRAPDLGKHFHQTLNEAFSEPKLGIVFCVDDIVEQPRKYFRDFSRSSNASDKKIQKIGKPARAAYPEPFVEYLSSHLPRQCRLTSCVVTGLIGTPVDFSSPVELEQTVGFASVFFPSIPGLESYTFSITHGDVEAFSEMDTRRPDPTSLDDDAIVHLTGIPKDREVKCLLVFLDTLPAPQDLTCFVLEHYMKKQNFRIALGGAIVDQVVSPQKSNDTTKQIAAGIAFVGETVQAASIVLEPSVRKPHQVLEKLNELKSCNFPEQNSVAFMFACCGRGTSFYKRPNVEAETFRKVFPTVPLFGLFGNGEIGNTFFPNGSVMMKKSHLNRDGSRPHWFHGYTTIFILLSWGKK